MVGMNPQMRRNKLNPEQPYHLTCDDVNHHECF
ncbi:phage regulatory CII family protein [Pectobacterium sp. CHL-2024]